MTKFKITFFIASDEPWGISRIVFVTKEMEEVQARYIAKRQMAMFRETCDSYELVAI